MKIPRWLMFSLGGLIMLVATSTLALWLMRIAPDVGGQWNGPGWGAVELKRNDSGGYDGTYTSTYGKDTGRIELFWSPRTRRFEGLWSEGTYRFGRVSVWATDRDTIRGVYSADKDCAREPGDPIDQAFQWQKGPAAFTFYSGVTR